MVALLRRYGRFGVPLLILLASLIMARTATASSSYTVQPGDTLYSIARKHDVTTVELAEANHIVNPRLIVVGQVLVIPDPGTATPEVEAKEIEVEDDVGDVDDTPGEAEPIASESANVIHVVQRGESLSHIAVRYGVTATAIQQANNIMNANVIFPGQRLTIPGADQSSGPELAAKPAPAPTVSKRIVVDKSEQRAYVYEDGTLLWTFVVSTGMPGSETWEGTYRIRSKIRNAYASIWDLQMPYWLGFYHTGQLENGFHALPIMSNGEILWDGYLGTPVSYGCVILSYADAETLYNWAEIGTEVVVQW